MTINSVVINALEGVGVPVAYQKYKGTATTYITFFEVIDVPKLHSDDELRSTQKTIQVDIWSKGNFTNVLKDVKSKLKSAGFLWANSREFYEDEADLFHYALTYNYQTQV